jgi:hypothetical protein
MNPFSSYYVSNPSLERRLGILVKGKFGSKWARMKLVHSWAESFGVGFSEYALSIYTKYETGAKEAITTYCNIMIASIYNGYNHLKFQTPIVRNIQMKIILHDTFGNAALDKAYELSTANPQEHTELRFFKQVDLIFDELCNIARVENVSMGSIPGGGFIPSPRNFLNNSWALEKFRSMCIPNGEELMRAAYRLR